MRIAMIGGKGAPAAIGGVERHIEELGARLVAGGFDVLVYARPWYVQRRAGTERKHRGMRVIVLASIATKHLDAITHTFLSTLHAMRERVDIYHFHGVGPSLLAWLPRLFRPHARVIATFHCVDRKHAKWGWFAREVLAFGEWAACRFPHETIAVGMTLQTYCLNRYKRETTYIPNGIQRVPDSARSPEAVADLARFGLTSKRYLLVVSRLVEHKEVHTVIDAFRTMQCEYPEYADLQLAIVGSPAFTDAYGDELRFCAAGNSNIRFLGQRSGAVLDALFANCLAFVHASRSEGLPIVVLEAGAAGVVPIVSDIPEHREVVAQTGGILFQTGNPWDCATKLAVTLRNPDVLNRIGAEIQAACVRTYNWEGVTAQTAGRYQSLIAEVLVRERPTARPWARVVV
ncbi:MAG: glycosyltransferase family 4 protein [Candidatus Uhrbacteria bacterium]